MCRKSSKQSGFSFSEQINWKWLSDWTNWRARWDPRQSARTHLDNWNILFSSSSLHVSCHLNTIFLPAGTICHSYGGTNLSQGPQTGSSLFLGSLRRFTLIYIKGWFWDLIINLIWFSSCRPTSWWRRWSLIDCTFTAGLINITLLSVEVKTLTWTRLTPCCPLQGSSTMQNIQCWKVTWI